MKKTIYLYAILAVLMVAGFGWINSQGYRILSGKARRERVNGVYVPGLHHK